MVVVPHTLPPNSTSTSAINSLKLFAVRYYQYNMLHNKARSAKRVSKGHVVKKTKKPKSPHTTTKHSLHNAERIFQDLSPEKFGGNTRSIIPHDGYHVEDCSVCSSHIIRSSSHHQQLTQTGNSPYTPMSDVWCCIMITTCSPNTPMHIIYIEMITHNSLALPMCLCHNAQLNSTRLTHIPTSLRLCPKAPTQLQSHDNGGSCAQPQYPHHHNHSHHNHSHQ